jgi:hypothetical protein
MSSEKRRVTQEDIEICRIRMEPREENLYSIFATGNSDRWSCENCKARGDKWFMMVHICKHNKRKKDNEDE